MISADVFVFWKIWVAWKRTAKHVLLHQSLISIGTSLHPVFNHPANLIWILDPKINLRTVMLLKAWIFGDTIRLYIHSCPKKKSQVILGIFCKLTQASSFFQTEPTRIMIHTVGCCASSTYYICNIWTIFNMVLWWFGECLSPLVVGSEWLDLESDWWDLFGFYPQYPRPRTWIQRVRLVAIFLPAESINFRTWKRLSKSCDPQIIFIWWWNVFLPQVIPETFLGNHPTSCSRKPFWKIQPPLSNQILWSSTLNMILNIS